MSGFGDWTIGSRGQEFRTPKDQVMHTALITTETTQHHEDRFVTAEDAIQERIRRLRETKTRFQRNGMTLRFEGTNGDNITITYAEPVA